MFQARVYHVYTRFNERVRIGDCWDPVDHVVITRRIFLSYTGKGVLVFCHGTNILKSYGVHEVYRDMMGCSLVKTLRFLKSRYVGW